MTQRLVHFTERVIVNVGAKSSGKSIGNTIHFYELINNIKIIFAKLHLPLQNFVIFNFTMIFGIVRICYGLLVCNHCKMSNPA